MDGIRTDRAAVNDLELIERLDIKIPFSPTTSEVRYDLRLPTVNYKGFFITGIPRSDAPGRFWFPGRGSLIKVANDGQHNNDAKDPIELLYAIHDLVTHLRLDPFRTPLNGIEQSVTISVDNPEQICRNIVSYVNVPPNYDTIDRDGIRSTYVEVKLEQYRLKLYSPAPRKLRIEIKINKMQFLGDQQSYTFEDLVQVNFFQLLAKKLLSSFSKIIWKCPNLKQADLSADQWSLYQNGRLCEYWQVRREDYDSDTEFDRVEQCRRRHKKKYKKLVEQHWPNESPAEIKRRIQQQLNQNRDLMEIPLYQALHAICQTSWQYFQDFPGVTRLPSHLKLPPLSEIYPLYLSKYSTPPDTPPHPVHLCQMDIWDSVENFHQQQCPNTVASVKQQPKGIHKRKKGQKSTNNNFKKSVAAQVRRLKKRINAPGGLLCSEDELKHLLPAKTLIALAYTGQNLNELTLPSVRSSYNCNFLQPAEHLPDLSE